MSLDEYVKCGKSALSNGMDNDTCSSKFYEYNHEDNNGFLKINTKRSIKEEEFETIEQRKRIYSNNIEDISYFKNKDGENEMHTDRSANFYKSSTKKSYTITKNKERSNTRRVSDQIKNITPDIKCENQQTPVKEDPNKDKS